MGRRKKDALGLSFASGLCPVFIHIAYASFAFTLPLFYWSLVVRTDLQLWVIVDRQPANHCLLQCYFQALSRNHSVRVIHLDSPSHLVSGIVNAGQNSLDEALSPESPIYLISRCLCLLVFCFCMYWMQYGFHVCERLKIQQRLQTTA